MRRRRRQVLAFAAAAVVATAAVGCDGGEEDPWEGDRPETLDISAGSPSGIYHAYGQSFAAEVSSRFDVEAEVLESAGSVENIERLATGSAEVAFASIDTAEAAVRGGPGFGEPQDISALARVYDDFAHLVVLADSEIDSVEDLPGHAVSMGAAGSGTAPIARRLLEAADIEAGDVDTRAMGLAQSLTALTNGEIDALFWSGGLDTPGLASLADLHEVRLVPLGELVEPFRSRYGTGYRHAVVPAGTYGVPEDVATLAVPNIVLVPGSMRAPVARALLAALFDAREDIARDVPAAALLDRRQAIYTEPIPLHPGALDYYRDTQE
ncbi:TAXI family TRAP transporter solute-binding subunit [Georgenia deserti]|uniref:TAXI family TRAP transporter solute-binding subunit n=1 Tax=Georgenia deserti TaxID=2093781 RepID=A0ABW4L8P5_9MICO